MKVALKPPCHALTASIGRLIREGVPGIPELTPANPWADGQPCPDGHFLCPPGTLLYRPDVPGIIDCPAIEINYGDAKPHPSAGSYLWIIPIEIVMLWERDEWESAEAESEKLILATLLTDDLQPPGDPLPPPLTAAARLTTEDLFIPGTRLDNFDAPSFQKVTLIERHPSMAFTCNITAGWSLPD